MANFNVLNALSTDFEDAGLIAQGLSNRGMIGYIFKEPQQNTTPLFSTRVTFPSGVDYVYTTDISREKFDGLKPDNQFIIGHVYTAYRSGTKQLHRYFHSRPFRHLFITNPHEEYLKERSYTDESDNNPIYIVRQKVLGTVALFLYSNSEIEIFVRKSESNAKGFLSIAGRQKELEEMLRASKREFNDFKITVQGNSINVGLIHSSSLFQVKLQDSKFYFTISRNPAPTGENYLIPDVDSWAGVVGYFKTWINSIDSASGTYNIKDDDSGSSSSNLAAETFDKGKVLTKIIEDKKFNKKAFRLLSDGDSLTVIVNNEKSFYNFYVNSINNDEAFTVRLNPEIKGHMFLTEVTWDEADDYFKEWLNAIAKEFPDLLNLQTLKLPQLLRKIQDIKISGIHSVEPVMGVEELASQVAKVINNLDSEPGNMVGIFGPWGRGKTYLMNQVWKVLEKTPTVKYVQVNYQAWRYQDTPASWAYLYEKFSEGYLGDKRKGFRSYIKYNLRLWDLNLEREGSTSLYIGLFLFLIIGFAGLFVIPFKGFWQGLLMIAVPPLSLLILTFVIKNLKLKHFTKAINLIKKYGIKTSFKENLGIQAEVQKELIHLVNAWTDMIKNGTTHKKAKIVLCVDDLDRCKEDKTIEIIDSLRIILDDEELKDKLIVISAVDERILNRAVSKKYDDFSTDELIKEYIDKLFIFGIKLGPLSEADSKEYFKKLIKDDIVKVETTTATTTKTLNGAPATVIVTKDEIEINPLPFQQEKLEHTDEGILEIDRLTDEEVQLLEGSLKDIARPTPRRIRIIYYRYLLARNLAVSRNTTGTSSSFWFDPTNQELLIKLLIHFSQKHVSEILTEKERVSNIYDDEQVSVYVIKKSPSGVSQMINKHEYTKLLGILEFVIAY